jgi:ATP-binding cassette subfamily B protein
MSIYRNPLQFFWTFISPEKRLFFQALCALLGATACNLIFPQLVRSALSPSGNLSFYISPVLCFATFFLLFAVQGVFFYFRSALFGSLGIKAVAEVRRRIFSSLLKKELYFFDTHHSAELVSRLSTDLQLVQEVVGQKISVLIRYAIQGIVGIILMFVISPSLSIIGIALLAPLIILSALLGKKLKSISRAQQQSVASASSTAQELLSGVKVIKVFGRYDSANGKYSGVIAEIVRLSTERVRMSAFLQSFVTFLLHTALAGLVGVGFWRSIHGSLSSGDLSAFLLYGVLVAVSFGFLLGSYTDIVHAEGAAERILEQLNNADVEAAEGALSAVTPKNGATHFINVSFTYPARPENEILHDVSFIIPANQITALVGSSGSGKTAVTELMLRFYKANSGNITFGGVDITQISLSDLRRSIGWVPQDPTLFAGTIRENLLIGDPQANDQKLFETLKKVNLLTFVEALPEKLSTKIGERGVQLSGGQKQRLAIARIFLKDPLLYIFDEITSALDLENENLLLDELLPHIKGKTVLMITHRHSTIQHADQVLQIESGKVILNATPSMVA